MNSTTKTFELVVARHGQTIANVKRQIQGSLDTPLTELGIQQARALAIYFCARLASGFSFNKIYASDLGRAHKTAQLIADSYNECDINNNNREVEILKVITDKRLRERSYGERFEGALIAELQEEAYQFGFNEQNFTLYSPSGVESMQEVTMRIENFFERELFVQAQENDKILIVTHWATIKEILKFFQKFTTPKDAISDEHVRESPNVAFSKFEVTTTRRSNFESAVKEELLLVKVICLHQTQHLKDDQNSVNIKHKLA